MSKMSYKRRGAGYPILVRERDGVRVLQFGRTVQSLMHLDGSGRGADYVELFHLVHLFRESIEKVLFIGLGAGSAPRAFVAVSPSASIEVVEIDPVVVSVAREHFGLDEGPHLTVNVGDGAAWVADPSRAWDAIVVDAYTAVRRRLVLPEGVTTPAFFAACRARLGDRGVLAFNCAAPAGGAMTRRVAAALRRALGFLAAFETPDRRNVVLFASASPLDTDPRVLRTIAREKLAAGALPSRRVAAGVLRLLDPAVHRL